MSAVYEQLQYLRFRANSLDIDIQRLNGPTERERLQKRVAMLEGRTSAKAMELYAEAKQELSECEGEISKLEGELSEVKTEITRLENDPTDHINEQVELMSNQFAKYVQKNYDTLAYDIETKFSINYCDPKCVEYSIKPKPIAISTEFRQFVIAEEKDNYFSSELTGVNHERCSTVNPPTTPWYKDFLERFYQALKEKIEEKNCYKDTFKITFHEDYTFTLGLI